MARNNEKLDELEAVRRHEQAVATAYEVTLGRLSELHRSCGLRPWEPSLDSPDFDPALVPSADATTLETITREARRLESRRLELREQLETARARREHAERSARVSCHCGTRRE